MRKFTIIAFVLVFTTSLFGQNYSMDGSPINDCTGFFLDSGGGSSDYAANENLTTTICSDNTSGTHILSIPILKT